MRFLIVLLLAVSWVGSALSEEHALPSTITIDGTTYEDVQWSKATATSVTLRHRTGVATIPLSKLSPDLQREFGYDPQKIAQSSQRVDAERGQKAVPAEAKAPNSTTSSTVANSETPAAKITGAFGVGLGASVNVVNVTGKKRTNYDPDRVYEYELQFQPSQPSLLLEEYYVWVTPKSKRVYCIEGLGKWDAGVDDTVKQQAKTLFDLLAQRYGHVVQRKSGFWESLLSSDDETIQIDKRRIVVGRVGGIFKYGGKSVSLIRMQVKYLDDDLEALSARENAELDAEKKQREEKGQADAVKRKFNPSGF